MPNRVLIGAIIALHMAFGTCDSHSVLSFAGPSTNPQEQTPTADKTAKERADGLLKSGRELRDRGQGNDDCEAAERKFREAAELYRGLRDQTGEAEAMYLLGHLLSIRDYHGDALPLLVRAAELARGLSDRRREALAIGQAGVASYWVQQFDKAIDYQERALALWRDLNDPGGQGRALSNLGLIYRELGQEERGVSYTEDAIPLLRAGGDRRGEISNLNNLSIHYATHNQLDKAFEGFSRNLEISRAIGDYYSEALALLNLGNVRLDQKRVDEAIALMEQALAVQQAHGIIRRQIRTLSALAWAYETKGQLGRKLEYLERAQTIAVTFGSYRENFDKRLEIVRLQRKLGQPAAVRPALEKTLKEIEEVYRKLRTDEIRTTHLRATQWLFSEAIDLLCELGDTAAAFNVAERARARALLDLIAEATAEIRQGIDPELKREQQVIQGRASSLRSRMLDEQISPGARREAETALKTEEEKLEQLARKIQSANPRYAAIRYPQPYDLARVQREVLAPGETLLEFTLGETRSFLWLVTSKEFQFRVLPGQAEIEKRLEPFLDSIRARPNNVDLQRNLEAIQHKGGDLVDLLFGDLFERIAASKHLLIVPDGPLYYLPFEALPIGGTGKQFLIEQADVTYAPSATVRGELRKPKSSAQPAEYELLAFADPLSIAPLQRETSAVSASSSEKPDESSARVGNANSGAPNSLAELERSGFHFGPLPMAREEVETIERLLGPRKCKIYVGAEATAKRLSGSNLRTFRRLHFATHGVIDEKVPRRSGLVLASASPANGVALLGMDEIFNLDLNADLVVLSACETGLGKLVQGEGILGLTRAFLYAGARNLVVSLWNVSDVSTAGLMESFYRDQAAGQSIPTALANAKRRMLAHPSSMLHHPYFWAPFVHIGDQ